MTLPGFGSVTQAFDLSPSVTFYSKKVTLVTVVTDMTLQIILLHARTRAREKPIGEKILVRIKNDPFSIRAAQLPYFNLIAWKRVIKASFLLLKVYP